MSNTILNDRTPLLQSISIRQYGNNEILIEDETSCNPHNDRIPLLFTDEDLDNITYSLNTNCLLVTEDAVDWSQSLTLSRHRYYSRLGFPILTKHVIPKFLIYPNYTKKPGTQGSLVTIFAIWNTMMGTSLLSMPWAIQQSGFALGILLMLVVAGLAFYTAYLVLKVTENLPIDPDRLGIAADFTDACRVYLGRPGEFVSILFSFLALLSGLIVYYVLLCNFLYSTVNYVYNYITNNMGTTHPVIIFNRTLTDVICYSMPPYETHDASFIPRSNSSIVADLFIVSANMSKSTNPLFDQIWSQTYTVPFWILIIILPLVSIKSPTFFTKFNALGTLSVLYLFFLVIVKVFKWGIHMDFSSMDYHAMIPNAKGTFIVLTGVGSLAFFIHNAIHSIVRNQSEPKNNVRDLFIAYVCVALTYLGIGILFYIAFPFAKDCIQDNLLNNLSTNDFLAFIGRIALQFQILTVLPLLMYILRSQFMYFFFKSFYPSWLHVYILHAVLLGICIVFSVFMPHIGEIARFSGAMCGLVYIFALPSMVRIQRLRREEKLSMISLFFHIGIIVIGILNFLGQFASVFANQ